tara:strand:- start:42 stop:515 length:474 start_codon:yes stop_codon:yes gene_type:complete
MDINTIARENIKTLMRQKKISVADLVGRYKFPLSTMYTYLNGSRKISLDKLDILKEALNVSYALLLSKNFYDINHKATTEYHSLYTNGRYYSHLSSQEFVERGKTIHYYRVIAAEKKTLQELGNMFNISRERVRQIQNEIVKRQLDKQTREVNESTN